MRTSTPSPARNRRVHTPPAPRLGALEDEWTPFTPRRSSRVAAQQRSKIFVPQVPHFPGKASTSRVVSQNSHLPPHPSPPSSPPPFPSQYREHTPLRSKRSSGAGSIRSRKRQSSPHSSDSDIDSNSIKSTKKSSQMNLGVSDPKAILPTPSKTPRKHEIASKDALGSTSRVLFHPRLVTADEAMPSPKKRSRKSLGSASSSLASVLFDGGKHDQPEKIEVYEDSRERIPTVDYDDDNPFIVRPGDSSTKPKRTRGRPQSQREAQMEQDTKHDRGLTYVFRGKKIFRRFVDAEDGDVEEEEVDEATLSDIEIKRQAGEAADTKLKRSSLKPRSLWPTKEQIEAKEAAKAQEAAEEALTDIELPPNDAAEEETNLKTNGSTDLSKAVEQRTTEEVAISTIIEPSNEQEELVAPSTSQVTTITESKTATHAPTNKLLQKPKRGRAVSPFDKWSRTKHGSETTSKLSGGTGSKREGSPLEKQAKRARNGAGVTESPTTAS